MILNANALHIPLASGTVQTCVTSPPYYGLRSYLGNDDPLKAQELGAEQTPAEYVANMVAVFREVWRVLKDDGCLWLNLGDSYATSPAGNKSWGNGVGTNKHYEKESIHSKDKKDYGDCKPKDLLGIPWRVAFALQDDGWYLRSDIIWHKPNPMPESVTDRPTKSHEYIFLLTKSPRYYYDAEAVKEDCETAKPESASYRANGKSDSRKKHAIYCPDCDGSGDETDENGEDCHTCNGTGIANIGGAKTAVKNEGFWSPPAAGRNRRTVWTVATQPYPGAHFATFPPKLIEPCILAGTSAKGQCPKCGAAWARVVERERKDRTQFEKGDPRYRPNKYNGAYENINGKGDAGYTEVTTTGWQPTCACDAGEPVPQIVLDPFSGSGTTGRVAAQHGRQYIGLELNPEYIKLAPERMTVQVSLL
jgi:DNA modification methylase